MSLPREHVDKNGYRLCANGRREFTVGGLAAGFHSRGTRVVW